MTPFRGAKIACFVIHKMLAEWRPTKPYGAGVMQGVWSSVECGGVEKYTGEGEKRPKYEQGEEEAGL